MLEMRALCERCGTKLAVDAEAFICAYECTFCTDCALALQRVCANCPNELTRRPRKLEVCDRCEPA